MLLWVLNKIMLLKLPSSALQDIISLENKLTPYQLNRLKRKPFLCLVCFRCKTTQIAQLQCIDSLWKKEILIHMDLNRERYCKCKEQLQSDISYNRAACVYD